MKNKDIENLVDNINGERLSEISILMKKRCENSEPNAIIMGYCASDEDTFKQVSKYIARQIGIKRKSIIDTKLNPRICDLIPYLKNNQDRFNNFPGEILMLRATGFERMRGFDPENKSGFYRVAHDYDQNVLEHQLSIHPDLRKKIIIVTHIGHSLGDDRYETAVLSACTSQFKSFVYEFKK